MDTIILGSHQFNTELAITEQEQQLGLMFCDKPKILTFAFNTSEIRKFWMKDTSQPLDLVFINQDKVVGFAYGSPFSLDLIGPNVVSNTVVELPDGTVERIGLKVGAKAQVQYMWGSLVKKMAEKVRNY